MALKIAILRETAPHEKRVAASPDTVKKLKEMGCNVMIEKDAGASASFTDAAYKEAGALIKASAEDTVKSTHIVLCVKTPDEKTLALLDKGTILIGMHAPYQSADVIALAAKHNIDLITMELMPRITRAQSMDVLSSQSNLAGYKSVLDACEVFPRALPMMMTAAGSIPPAKVFVMGAGVAGLQAIATARRLGAAVTATDVRPAAKEQVESLGAKFVAVENEEFKEAETAGGYAKEMSKEYQKLQAELVESHIAKQDIVITTALIPGRPAPKLISKKMVHSMQSGSVIVDLAVEMGGNCELAKAGEIVDENGVKIVGHYNVPSRIARDSSALYAKNLLNFLQHIIEKEKAELNIDDEDEIIKAVRLTHGGEIVHPNFAGEKAASKPAAKKTTASKPKAGSSTKTTAKKTTKTATKTKQSSRTKKEA